ncbi:hypothetical protein ET495_14720 [Xylanimonas allomyrinae]|uniref:Uncharacterized protein n=1 Tax=Xylanimonas allomyrinae TaxID=2509459 RepID=A0A4V0YEH7_9MICO|nr:hypothetical protein [Xylanimonas allomyrinae]QAY64251.1 hypothetical protein ET495_14720 [Xylanimonas allomyrinae]
MSPAANRPDFGEVFRSTYPGVLAYLRRRAAAVRARVGAVRELLSDARRRPPRPRIDARDRGGRRRR